jgi:hypothetical protein
MTEQARRQLPDFARCKVVKATRTAAASQPEANGTPPPSATKEGPQNDPALVLANPFAGAALQIVPVKKVKRRVPRDGG